MLFAKIPDENDSFRLGYDMDQFYITEYQKEKYELIFQDNMGSVYASPFSDEEIYSDYPVFDIKKYFGKDLDVLKDDVTIAFFVDTAEGTMLEGWYKNAEIYKECHYIAPRNRKYYFKASAADAVWLSNENRIKTEIIFHDFIVPSLKEAKKINDFIAAYSGSKRNLVFEEELGQMKSPKIRNINHCVKKCEDINSNDNKTPADDFKIIKMCLQTREDCGGNEEIFGLLADSYYSLGQDAIWVQYNQLRFEANPSYENKMDYAVSLFFSTERNKSLSLFQELMEEKPTDLIRTGLADLYFEQNHLLTAYQIYDEIQDEEHLHEKHEAMELIKKYLPNAPTLNKVRNVRTNSIIEISAEKSYLPINDMPLPREQNIDGRIHYLDPIRNKPILKTPEEEIRQKTLYYLMNCLNVPAENIKVEESLSHFDKSLKDRMDIFVFCYEKGIPRNLLIVECKEPNVSVFGDPVQQILRYNSVLPSRYLLITNGNDSLIFANDPAEDSPVACAKLPDFKRMCSGFNVETYNKTVREWKRPSRAWLETADCLDNANYNGTVGIDSEKDIKVLAVNMHYCLVDPEERFPDKTKGLLCRVMKDHGVTSRTSTDASGGRFNLNYRWLEVVDRNGDTQNIYLAVVAFAYKKQTTNLLVSVEDKGKAKMQLSLYLDKHTKKDGEIFTITHNGTRSRATNKSTIDFVAKHCPQLLKNGEIYLGSLDNSKNLSLNGDREKEFFMRVIDYTLLRYELWLDERKDH